MQGAGNTIKCKHEPGGRQRSKPIAYCETADVAGIVPFHLVDLEEKLPRPKVGIDHGRHDTCIYGRGDGSGAAVACGSRGEAMALAGHQPAAVINHIHDSTRGSGNITYSLQWRQHPHVAPILTRMDYDLGNVSVAALVASGAAALRLEDTADQVSGLGVGDGSEAERVGRRLLGRLADGVGKGE